MSVSPEKRTIPQWVHYLSAPDAPLTLSELMALMLLHIRDNAVVTQQSSEHVEGMLGAIDAYLAERDPENYPGSARVRQALAAQRKAQDKAQDKALKEGHDERP